MLTEHAESWQAARQKQAENADRALRLQIDQLTARQEALTDALIDRLIDKDTFQNRKVKIDMEAGKLRQRLSEAEKSDPTSTDLADFLEQLKSLKTTYEMAEPAEQRQLIEWATSNRVVDGKSIGIAPSKWLRQAEAAVGVCFCAQTHPNSRSSRDIDLAALAESMRAAKAEKPHRKYP